MHKAVIALLAVSAVACTQTSAPDTTQPGIACTEEARQCPDGSFVGRSGPQCEFICPSATPN